MNQNIILNTLIIVRKHIFYLLLLLANRIYFSAIINELKKKYQILYIYNIIKII